ncbi:hypothetical protein GJA_3098 [Janthinobacterium agaricidamnosum NBRC 102515 = DSM 9628]|uniref:Uncharacterized protein n=1 Tax=Janthinobacterium agaricidamnosum NBRC 102515 = DSM 9628 TaxID=1349767 RepID=W0V4G5_9BURK|nr:hypothetical protein GJA_3098 [Janthinobacterium agaricidamnosum NBRC 102515 = DSM 9628]
MQIWANYAECGKSDVNTQGNRLALCIPGATLSCNNSLDLTLTILYTIPARNELMEQEFTQKYGVAP